MRARSLPLVAVLLAVPAATALSKDEKIEHILSRLTFGARPGDAARVRAIGLDKWIDLQLRPERIAEEPALEERLRAFTSLSLDPPDIARRLTPANRRMMADHAREIMAAKIARAVYSNRQLQEVLVDFWYNHFNVHFDKGADRVYVNAYERDVIRPRVLGRFADLLAATARHPAMLFYLDNWQSAAPGSVGRFRGLNENYARELLELHTLGAGGGFSQQDVVEAARCFTGWTIRTPRQGGGFQFNERLHDRGEKVVLGVKIPAGGGIEDGERVLEILARHPSTARFISRKLAVRFVSDDPPKNLVDRMARTFLASGGDLREVMRTMVGSKEFFSSNAYRAKVKSPLETAISAVRALDADVRAPAALAQAVARLGQPLYRKPEPNGYPNASAEWINSGALLARMNFGIALAGNRIPGVRVDTMKFVAPPGLSKATRAALVKLADRPAEAAGLWLGSPDFQRR